MLPAIKLIDVPKQMERRSPVGDPVPFRLVAVSASRRRPETSGKIIVIDNSILARMLKYVQPDSPLAERREFTPQLQKQVKSKPLRNSVRRIWKLQENQFRNIHIRLIMTFNDRPVIP